MREEQEAYFEENDIEELVIRYEESLKTNIKQYFDVCEFEIIIDFYLENFQFIEADDVIKIAFVQHPNSVALLLKKCQVLLEREKPEEALQILNKLERMESSNVDFYICKGHAYCFLEKLNEAENEFRKALDKAFDDKEELYLSIASILIQFEYYTAAKKILLKAKDEFPQNCDIMQELAVCFDRLNDQESAVNLYNTILDFDPYLENTWFNLGLLYERNFNYVKAIEAYEFVVAINENFSIAYLNLGNVYICNGNYNEAIKAYKEYLQYDEKSPDIYSYIGECYEKLEDYINAKEFYLKATLVDPSYADAWYGLGVIDMYQENYFESIDFIIRAIEIEDDNYEYWQILGKIYLKIGFHYESKQIFKKAIDLNVYDHESWLLFSELYWRERNYNKAIEILKEGYVYNNNVADYNYKLSAYLLATNQKKSAVKYFKNAYTEDKGGYSIIYNYVSDHQIPKEIKSLININN